MSTTTPAPAGPAGSATGAPATGRRLTFGGLVRSEWIKFWSVRSLVWTTAAAGVCTVAVGVVACAVTVAVAGGAASPDPSGGGLGLLLSLSGAGLATVVVAVVGALSTAGEYSTGTIRTTLATAPRPGQVLVAKAVVLATVVTVVLGSSVLAAFLLGQALLASIDHDASLGDPGVLRVVLGHVAVLTGVALMASALGALTRSTIGTLGAVVALLFVLPLLSAPLPDFPGDWLVDEYSFTAASNALTSPGGSWVAAAGAFGLWVALALGLGAYALGRRDVH